MKNEEKIYEMLQKDDKLFRLALFLIEKGAGTLLDSKLFRDLKKIVAWELTDALSKPAPGDWHYEIAQMVLKKDKKKMEEVAKDIQPQIEKTAKCSKCESSFTYVRISTQERVCRNCGYIEKIPTKR